MNNNRAFYKFGSFEFSIFLSSKLATLAYFDPKLSFLSLKFGVSRMGRVRNEEVRRRAEIERELASRADERVLRWFGHVERMNEYCMARRVLMAEVSGGWVQGRLRLGWMDGVKVALGNRGMTVEAARQCAKDQKEWRALPGTYVTE